MKKKIMVQTSNTKFRLNALYRKKWRYVSYLNKFWSGSRGTLGLDNNLFTRYYRCVILSQVNQSVIFKSKLCILRVNRNCGNVVVIHFIHFKENQSIMFRISQKFYECLLINDFVECNIFAIVLSLKHYHSGRPFWMTTL